MNYRLLQLIAGFTILVSRTAHAANTGDDGASDTLTSTLLSFLPIAIFLCILYFFFRRQMKSPLATLQQQYLNNQIQHAQRVEELLERIATALEKNDKNIG